MEKKYILNKIVVANSSQLSDFVKSASVALTITSPPYRNAIDYSQHISNLKKSQNIWMRGTSTQTTESYLNLMEKIFSEVYKSLLRNLNKKMVKDGIRCERTLAKRLESKKI